MGQPITMCAHYPRPQTFDVLSNTRNAAVIGVLDAGLNSPLVDIRQRCAALLLARQELVARQSIIRHWTRLDSSIRSGMSNNKFELEPACRSLLVDSDQPTIESAIAAILELDITAALPELIELTLNHRNPAHSAAMQALLTLCDAWGQRARSGRDVPTIRTAMVDALQRVVYEYPAHKNTHIIDAWLVLVTWEDSAHRAIVNDPMHPAYRVVLDRLWNSQHASIVQLLGGYLWRASTPKSILSIICERADQQVALTIATMVDDNLMAAVLKRLRELPQMVSLTGLATRIAGVAPEVQRRLWMMLAANSPTIDPVLAGAVAISKMGGAEFRRMAADIIRTCRDPNIERIVQHLQHAAANPDDTHSVGAQLMTMLSWIGGASTVLDAAARDFFAQFTLAQLLDVVRKWPTPLCRVLAQVVSRIEPDVVPQLLKSLESPAPKRRLIALQAIRLLDVSSEINERLLPLVHDSRLEIRIPAIDFLSVLGAPELAGLLPELLADPTTDVQDAAMRAQRRLDRKRQRTSGKSPKSALPLPAIATQGLTADIDTPIAMT